MNEFNANGDAKGTPVAVRPSPSPWSSLFGLSNAARPPDDRCDGGGGDVGGGDDEIGVSLLEGSCCLRGFTLGKTGGRGLFAYSAADACGGGGGGEDKDGELGL